MNFLKQIFSASVAAEAEERKASLTQGKAPLVLSCSCLNTGKYTYQRTMSQVKIPPGKEVIMHGFKTDYG